MSVSLSVSSYSASNGIVYLRGIIKGATDVGDRIVIEYKNTDASFYSLYGESVLDMGATEETVIDVSLKCGRLFTGTSKTFKITWNGQYGTASVVLPMSYTPNSYIISERPIQQTQYVFYNGIQKGEAGSCIANTLVSCVEVLKMRTSNIVYPYSVGWIFGGAGNGVDDYLYYDTSLNFLKTNGVPPSQVMKSDVATGYPDVYFQPDAKVLFNNNYSTNLKYATPQKIGTWTKLTSDSSWNFESIFNALQRENTTVMVELNINKALDNAYSSGWVGTIKNTQRGGHSMIVLGWVVNGGNYYWVCQNSWCYPTGSPYGDNGIYYIPFDHFTYDGMGLINFYAMTRDESAPTMPPIPEDTGSPVLMSRSSTGFVLSCNPVVGATYEFRYRKEGESAYTTKASSTNNITISGLSSGYTYYLSVRFLRNGIYGIYSQESQCTVLPAYPDIDSVYSTTPNNLIVKLKQGSMSGKFSYVKIIRKNHPYSSSDASIDYKIAYDLATLSEWTGLTTGLTYSFVVVGILEINGVVLQSRFESTSRFGTVGSIRPSFFSWDTPKKKGEKINVTADEWNKLMQNINELAIYKGKSKITFTEVKPNMPISLIIYREASLNIILLGSIAPFPSRGDTITADHFNKLAEGVNSIS